MNTIHTNTYMTIRNQSENRNFHNTLIFTYVYSYILLIHESYSICSLLYIDMVREVAPGLNPQEAVVNQLRMAENKMFCFEYD